MTTAVGSKPIKDSTRARRSRLDDYPPECRRAMCTAIECVVKFETVTVRECTDARLDLHDYLWVQKTGGLPGDRRENADIRDLMNAVADARRFAELRERGSSRRRLGRTP